MRLFWVVFASGICKEVMGSEKGIEEEWDEDDCRERFEEELEMILGSMERIWGYDTLSALLTVNLIFNVIFKHKN